MKRIVGIIVGVAALALTACGSNNQIKAGTTAVGGTPQSTATKAAAVVSTVAPTATATVPPTPAFVTVSFFFVNPKLTDMRFVATIHNPASQAVSGLKMQWNAVDATGALVGSFTSTMPDIAAGADFLYVGGQAALSSPASRLP